MNADGRHEGHDRFQKHGNGRRGRQQIAGDTQAIQGPVTCCACCAHSLLKGIYRSSRLSPLALCCTPRLAEKQSLISRPSSSGHTLILANDVIWTVPTSETIRNKRIKLHQLS